MKRVTINTNYVGLVFKNGELKRVLTAGSILLHLLTKNSDDYYG